MNRSGGTESRDVDSHVNGTSQAASRDQITAATQRCSGPRCLLA